MSSDLGLFNEPKKRFNDFALKDYELKVQYMTSNFQRMWTRFKYFVVIQAALIGDKTIFGEISLGLTGVWFGFGLSVVWYDMGAEERFLVQQYCDQVKEAAAQLSSGLALPAYRYVGDPDGGNEEFRSPHRGWLDFITAWRLRAISTTRLASLLPLIVSLIWLGLLTATLVRR